MSPTTAANSEMQNLVTLTFYLGKTRKRIIRYLCGDSKYTGHVETSCDKIIDVDCQLDFFQPVIQRVVVSHLLEKKHEKVLI